jgi:ABC-2 type transport system ATP-binding protein
MALSNVTVAGPPPLAPVPDHTAWNEVSSAGDAPVVRIEGLVKRLRRGVTAVDELDLEIQKGEVWGLAGPNGSGKTLTLRMLLGLVRPTAGKVFLFGEPVRPGAQVLGRVGALVDGPGFVPHLSGLANLRLAWRLTRGPADEAGLEPALDYARLGEALHRPYSTYSHGMRYRLGFAQALLGRPELLILDEPATGLDPLHVRELRAALAALAAGGTTILMSSHVLAEVQETCTHVAVMEQGRLVASGRVADLVGRFGAGKSLEEAYVELVTGPRASAGERGRSER